MQQQRPNARLCRYEQRAFLTRISGIVSIFLFLKSLQIISSALDVYEEDLYYTRCGNRKNDCCSVEKLKLAFFLQHSNSEYMQIRMTILKAY